MGLQIRQKLSSLGPIFAIDAPSPTGSYPPARTHHQHTAIGGHALGQQDARHAQQAVVAGHVAAWAFGIAGDGGGVGEDGWGVRVGHGAVAECRCGAGDGRGAGLAFLASNWPLPPFHIALKAIDLIANH